MFFDHVDDVALLEEKYLNGEITPYDFLDQIEPIDRTSEKKVFNDTRPDKITILGSKKLSVKKGQKVYERAEILKLLKSDMIMRDIRSLLSISYDYFYSVIKDLGLEKEYKERNKRIRALSFKNRRRRRKKSELDKYKK